jgi:hypothetical protein
VVLLAMTERSGPIAEISLPTLKNGPHMMMRTVFSLSLLILPISMVGAADQASLKSEADLATLIRSHGFVNTTLVQKADEATVGEIAAAAEAAPHPETPLAVADSVATGEVIVEPSPMPEAMADDGHMQTEGESGFEAPIRQPHYHSAPQRRSSKGGLFSELMELERRKNAWLKRTFLGR